MFDIGDKVEYGGVMLTAVAFFDQPTVVLENEAGERVTVALTSLIYNRMQQVRSPTSASTGTDENPAKRGC